MDKKCGENEKQLMPTEISRMVIYFKKMVEKKI